MLILYLLLFIKAFVFCFATGVEQYFVLISLITVAISWIILGLIARLPGKVGKVLSYGFYVGLSLFMFADAMYYSYFWTFITFETIVQQGGQLGSIVDVILLLLTVSKALLIIDIPLVIIFNKKIEQWSESVTDKLHLRVFGYGQRKQPLKLSAALVLASMILFSIVYNAGGEATLFSQEFFHFHGGDILKVGPIHAKSAEIESTELFTTEDVLQLKENARLKQGKWTGIGKGKNLIVIQVESLQNFVVNNTVDGQVITPNINEFLKEKGTVYYDNYFHITSMGSTSDAEFVTNNSLHPSTEAPTYKQYEGNTFYGLPWLLRDNGYNAWVFHGFERAYWNRDKAYPQMGFQRYLSQEDYSVREKIGFGITDKDFFKQSIPYLKELDNIDDNPFYAFLITLTSHTPYEMPAKEQKLKLPEYMEGTYLGNYLQSIHYTDEAIGQFIQSLKDEGLYDDSIVVLYGDHYAVQVLTPEIGETMQEYLGHQYRLDEITNVPLIMHIPGVDESITNSETCSMMDFYPTVQNLLGVDNEKGIVFGEDINNMTKPHVVKPQTILRRGSFITNDIIYSVNRDEIFTHGQVYDRKTYELIDDVSSARELYEETSREIGLGEYILRKDLLKPILAGEEIENLVKNDEGLLSAKPLYEWDGMKTMLRRGYQDGVRQVLVKGRWVDGNKGLNSPDRLLLGESDMDLSELLRYKRDNPELQIILESAGGNETEFFEKLKKIYPEASEQIIAGIRKYDSHFFVGAYGFNDMVLDLRGCEYEENVLKDFLKGKYLPGVILPDEDNGILPAAQTQGEVVYFRAPREKGLFEKPDDELLQALVKLK
ncbi:MAG: LTA synthase family protein [Tissierellia bacterium]|nr:LTA synthase family protein [Tissierellia bacterium]